MMLVLSPLVTIHYTVASTGFAILLLQHAYLVKHEFDITVGPRIGTFSHPAVYLKWVRA